MPKLSADTLLRRAIEPAIQDRLSFADAYGANTPEAAEALDLVKEMKALAEVRLAKMSPEQLRVAAQTFIFAEQWEVSLADAQPKGPDRARSLKTAAQFLEVRQRIWGKTRLELEMEASISVEVMPVNRVVEFVANDRQTTGHLVQGS